MPRETFQQTAGSPGTQSQLADQVHSTLESYNTMTNPDYTLEKSPQRDMRQFEFAAIVANNRKQASGEFIAREIMPTNLLQSDRYSKKRYIIIYCQNLMINRLFRTQLATSLGVDCEIVSQFEDLLTVKASNPVDTDLLTVVDFREWQSGKIAKYHKQIGKFVLVNANINEINLEELIGLPEIRGVFFSGCTSDVLIRGLTAVFEGEIWFPRACLSAYLARTRTSPSPSHKLPINDILTKKELEILRLISKGNSNAAIANTLSISCYTVKTHVYNIFKKINASNRVQAIRWAQDHSLI